MSNSTAPPDSSPPSPAGDKSPPPPDNNNSSPPPSDNSSPPPAPPNSPPPQSPPPSSPPPTDSSPPPTDNSSPPPPPPSPPQSPPPASKSPPPKSSSPPPTSNPSPPPPHSSKSPPPPPPPTDSSTPPPSSDSPPSPPPTDSSSPPPTDKASPPAPDKSPPPPPPSEFVPPPTDQFSPPPPLSENAAPPPPKKHHLSPPPATPPTQHSPIAPPTSQTPPSNGTTPSPSGSTTPHSPPSHGPSKSALPLPAPPPSDSKGAAIGGAVAGIVIIAFLAILFVARRRKRRSAVYATQYMPPNSFSSKSDGFYMHNSGPQSGFYSQPQQSFHGNSMGHSYGGSQRGNSYYQTPSTENNTIGGAQSLFTYEELMEITNGFSQQNIIGEGGFGCVYKGSLRDGRVVAVKQLKKGSGQGEREFRAEVEIISRVHHRYLVSLVGYCICDTQRLLIYEYVPNQTLEHHLHGKDMPVLEWSKRLKIALGAARGLAYLHDDCHPKIIHRDIKSANILLDDAYEAQVADFGLAKLTDDTNTHVSTRVMGTFGYMAPEYASSGKLTDRSDVFSFGVVLLELITGRKPVDQTQPMGDESVVEWARPLLGRALDTGDFTEIVDSRLEKHYVEAEMFRMVEAAAACVRHSAPKRPRMKQVARALDCEEEASDLSNGVRYGQSTIYESGQYNQDISRFRKMAFGSGGSKEFDMYSGDYTTSIDITDTSSDIPSGESETQAMNARNGDGGRRFR